MTDNIDSLLEDNSKILDYEPNTKIKKKTNTSYITDLKTNDSTLKNIPSPISEYCSMPP